MPLFLDRLPFHTWTDQTKTPPKTYWSVVVFMMVTESSATIPPAHSPVQAWVIDSANSGEAFAWRSHLLSAGLDPNVKRTPGKMVITSSIGSKVSVPIRDAALWLVSNVPALQPFPFRIALDHGIPFHDLPTLPDPYFNRPILGVRAMRKAGLRVELDFANDTLSLWTPDWPTSHP